MWSRNLCPDGERICKVCNTKKPQTEYHKSKNSTCKSCILFIKKQEYWNDLETSRLQARIWASSTKAKIRKINRYIDKYREDV